MAGDLSGIFAEHALGLLAYGLAVLPTGGDDGKAPLVKGYRRWKWPPSPRTIKQLARKFPDANTAMLPELSKVFVADVDSADQVAEVEKLLGRTPLHVVTNRGRHLYYRNHPSAHDLPANLAALGLKVDLKAGNSIVLTPPSRHDSGAIYRHDGCDWQALKKLPRPNLHQLQKALASKPPPVNERYTEGQRGLGINRIMCRHVAFCDDFEGLLDVARSANADFIPPLPDSEVVKRARQVWRDFELGKIEPWVGRAAVARTRSAEIKELAAAGRNGSHAFMLLMLFKAEHGARCRRGQTFHVSTRAMQEAQTIPGWTRERYAAARDLLLKTGHIVLVSASRSIGVRWLPAAYRLALEAGGRGQSGYIVSGSSTTEVQP